jgi:hypothetical protein
MPHTRSLLARLVAVTILAFLAVPASATVLVQNTRAEWEAQALDIFTIDFEGLATPSSPGNYSTSAGLTLTGVTFVGDNLDGTYFLRTYDSATGGTYNWASGDYILGSGWGVKYITVSLPSNVMAVAADVMTNAPGNNVTVTLSVGGSHVVHTFANPTHAFIGFTSDIPIEWIRFSAANSYTVIDNFSFGTLATPELDTRVLAGFGLAGLWLARRLRRYC